MTEERSYLSALDSKQFNARVLGQMKRRREVLNGSEALEASRSLKREKSLRA